jgi:fructokinase
MTRRGTSAFRVYDVNLRDGCWTPTLVRELLDEASVLKLNDHEVVTLADALDLPGPELETFAAEIAARFALDMVCVTCGAAGAMVWTADGVARVDGLPIRVVDTIGAGDAFTAGLVDGLVRGLRPEAIVQVANALGALVASREGAIPAWEPDELASLMAASPVT